MRTQKGWYAFQFTTTGTNYDPRSMFSHGGNGQEGIVRFCLWPGLLKLSENSGEMETLVIEEVYTMPT